MPPVPPLELHTIVLIAAAGLFAGVQNALAGGGSFITFPALLLAGLNPLAANMTSTIAMFPSQATSAVAGRKLVDDVGPLTFRQMFLISVVGGVLGAILLRITPPTFFARLVPWLVLFATSMFAWGAFRKQPMHAASSMPKGLLVLVQSCIAIYGGYFGGGIGFLMLAALTIAGQQIRAATATKNMLAMAMNAAATAIFAFSSLISWPAALALCAGGIAGGLAGSWLIYRLPPRLMRIFVVIVGALLTVYMFLR
ncbi:sulfite exporter TauE/SafE family protein [Massilia sp. MB5]|uniref:sulfite exporter TauE/SafE family protein n=1 Tax=unclassified Massilia TaxID=2609279 RepID=UPI00067D9101|nr:MULTISPECIES: sulfite exporter TauE/SafE family protein [unclassified Massilia]AKU24433.1 transporter [Massilia sp. NR 4-1]UMR30567.1 sulfite exporter TauE/SafE family protein [Massilia sp. MB5]